MSLARPCALLCGCLLLACTAPAPAPEQPPPPATPPAAVAPAPVEVVVKAETPPDPAPPPAAEPAPAISLDTPIGVEACDAYVSRYRTCIAERVTDKERHTKTLQAQVANWLAAKADPKLAAALDGECAAASEAARALTRAIGCVWREGDTSEPEIPKGGSLKPETRMVPRGLPGDPFGELD